MKMPPQEVGGIGLSLRPKLPKRVERCRTAGWRMPDAAVYVGRPTRWGNPFPITTSRQHAVDQYAAWLPSQPGLMLSARQTLKGRDLVCWCPLDQPCHADLLLQIANSDADVLISAHPDCPKWASVLVDLLLQEAA